MASGKCAFLDLAASRCTESELPIYVVNAFTNKPFGGNPAAICLPGQQVLCRSLHHGLS